MSRKLTATTPTELEWDIPDMELYDEIITTAAATFVETDITRADALNWSSVGMNTGIGVFAMDTARLDLIAAFRAIIRNMVHDDLEFETVPKESLLASYGLTLYAHKGTRPFRATKMIEILRRSNPRLKGEVEVVEVKEFPLTHAIEKKRGVRIITLLGDQDFLDSLYEYPPNYPFTASILRNLYIRGGSRRNPKDPLAQKPQGRTRMGKKALRRFVNGTSKEVLNKAADDLTDKMSGANLQVCLLYTSPSPRD